MAGITPEGFTKKTIEEIKLELESDELENIDPALNLAADQPVGQLNAIFSKKVAECWELAEVAYNAFDRDASEDRLLDNIGSITGTPRRAQTKSEVTLTLTLGAGFSAAPGTMMANVLTEPAIQFVNKSLVTSVGAGAYTAIFQSVAYGPIQANAGTITQITNAVTGWSAVNNLLDAIPGTLVEEDADYRQRQDDELTAGGSSTVDAIRTDLLKVAHVLQAYCFENVTLFTDGNGVPGKAIECVIYDGASPTASDVEIAQAIWDSKPSGSETYGTTTANATDSLGILRAVKFSRAAVTNIYLEYDVSVDASKFPVDGVALIKNAAVEKGNELNLDGDVIALALRACVLSPVVAGVTDVVALRLGLSASPVGTSNIVITGRAIARFDTTRVVVNLV